MPDIFLSYSRQDQPTARRFAESLEREGFSVWWDQTLRAGEDYDEVTEAALRGARAVAVLWSATSVSSRWVRAEATTAQRLGTLAPVMIEVCDRPIMFELKQTADLSHWQGDRDDPAWRRYVEDLWRLVGRDAPAGPAAAPVPGRTVDARRGRGARTGRLVAIAALVAVLVAGAAAWALLRHRDAPAAAGSPSAPVAPKVPVTLAVLPFANLSADAEQEYFSDGLTEEILNQLSQVRELRVTGRTSSFSFKGKNEDLRAIASQLGVANLLEGSIRKNGAELRITAQLIDGRDGAHRWSRAYDRKLQDVFSLQEEIARDVAQALSITLDVGEMSRERGGTTNLEAYESYLRGRQALLGVGPAQAARLLREAVALDPQFARAWLALVWALENQTLGRPAGEVAPLLKELQETGDRLIALAPDTWQARVVRAYQLERQRNWVEDYRLTSAMMAESPLTAANLDKSVPHVRVIGLAGRLDEVIGWYRTGIQLEPLMLIISSDLQAWLQAAGRYDEAGAEYERTKALSGDRHLPEFNALVRMLLRQPLDLRAVRAQMRLTWGEKEQSWPAGFAQFGHALPDRKAAAEVLRRTLADPVNEGLAAMIYPLADALGDADLALAALRTMALKNGFYQAIWSAPNSGVRSSEGFKAVLRELGIVDFWRATGKWADSCHPVGSDDFQCR